MPRFRKKTGLTLRRKWTERTRKRKINPVSPKAVLKKKFKVVASTLVHRLSPLSSRKKKQQRLTLVSPSPCAPSIPESSTQKLIQNKNFPTNIKESKRKLEFENANTCDQTDDVLETANLLKKLVQNGSFSTDNISYKLFKDTLKWHACSNVSSMRYCDEVKEFFWTGRRLLGGQFLRFMRGYGHQGMVVEGKVQKGVYCPMDTSINLPVPSDRALSEFRPCGIDLPTTLKPGIINENISLYSEVCKNRSCVIMFDGKKIVPNSADVFLLGAEDEPKLADIQAKFEEKLSRISMLIDSFEQFSSPGNNRVDNIPTSVRETLQNECRNVVKDLSNVTKSLRETYAKKKSYIVTLQKRFIETEDGKYKYALNKMQTLLYQINICLKDLLEVIDSILHCCAVLNATGNDFKVGTCVLEAQDNYRELKPPESVKLSCGIPDFQEIPPNLIKQRTQEWFQLRNNVKVTGSVLHKAVGIDTLVAQREHFDVVIGGKQKSEVSKIQKEAMDHGTENEVNAIATIVSKIIPVYYPGYTFFEEGTYVIKDENDKDIVIVSPDGSLRNDKGNVVSVEIKCPCPQFVGSTPVYYDVKQRHVIQNLAEAHVLGTEEHLYISWSKQSTTVFRMKSNSNLITRVLSEVKDIYYIDIPKRPTRISESSKEIKANVCEEISKAEFLCEVPSVMAITNSIGRNQSNSPYYEPVIGTISNETDLDINEIIQSLLKGKKTVMEAHNIQKPMASEVLIHLLSDMDRTWKREVGHGLPVSFLYKGYSLTMATSRSILDSVRSACNDKNIHVACVAFDGQFASMKDYDSDGNPLSLFVHQRQFWSKVKKMTKRDLINDICNIFQKLRINTQEKMSNEDSRLLAVKTGCIAVSNGRQNYNPIISRVDLIFKKSPVSIGEESISPEKIDCTGLDEEVSEILEGVIPYISNIEIDESAAMSDMSTSDEGTNSARTNQLPDSDGLENANGAHLSLEDKDYDNMYHLLCQSKTAKKLTVRSASHLKVIFESAEEMNRELKGQSLHEIVKYLNVKLTKFNLVIKQSLRKADKINKICEALHINSKINAENIPRRTKSIKTLKSMCIFELQKRSYPKDAIAASYAECCWPTELNKWYESSWVHVEKEVSIHSVKENCERLVFSPLYSPEYNSSTEQILVKVMDGTHIRTNIKSKLIRSDQQNVKVKAWKAVALSGRTNLARAMLEIQTDGKLMHQQSDAHFRTMFSEEVEKELKSNGNKNEANFCHLFREWHEAEDKPGISASERVNRCLKLREWLLNGYRFDQFPPQSQYVRGIPRVTFEGLICSIDAHILLYAICKGGTFNWRSVSTLVAENFMGELAERSQNNHGVPSGTSLAADMTKISELHAMRLKPDRSFQMKTAKSRVYSVTNIENQSDTQINDYDETIPRGSADTYRDECANQKLFKISTVNVRNHEFDIRAAGKVKHGILKKFGQQPRGVQSVRSHYKVDESKILPSVSLNLPDDMLEI